MVLDLSGGNVGCRVQRVCYGVCCTLLSIGVGFIPSACETGDKTQETTASPPPARRHSSERN